MSSTAKQKTNDELQLGNAPATKDENNVAALVTTSTPEGVMGLIQSAIDGNAPVEAYERLYALHEKMCDRQARIEYNKAMVAFQTECPPVKKGGINRSLTDSGGKGQRYARLEEDILPVVAPVLLKHGLSYTWDTETSADRIHVVCTLRHIAGYESRASFAAPPDDRQNRALSPAQKNGAVETYCRRLSLIQVTGLRVGDSDTDAAPGEKITESQAADLRSSLEEHKLDESKFLKYMKAESLEDIPLTDLGKALTALEKKRQAQ